MRQFIQTLNAKVEFAVILVGAFGYLILNNLLAVSHPAAFPHISEGQLEFGLIYESVALTMLCWFLHWRGWSTKRIGLNPTTKDSLIGLGLALATYLAVAVVWMIAAAASILPGNAGTYPEMGLHNLRVLTVIAVAVLNPVFEETFLAGYIISTAKEAGLTVAGVILSVAIRLLCHLYQGSFGVVTIVPLGFVFAWWYARTGRLWPLFIAHSILDTLGLLQFLGGTH